MSEVPPANHEYKFNVTMTCGGCSGAVERALALQRNKDLGIESSNVDLGRQEVVVTGPIEYVDLLRILKKTRKTVVSASKDGEAQSVDLPDDE